MQTQLLSRSYEVSSSQFSAQSSFEQEECAFCSEINIIRCMSISVQNKHNEESNWYLKLGERLVQNCKSPLTIKFAEVIKSADTDEHLMAYCSTVTHTQEIRDMLEYYKFRKFVPLFADVTLGKTLHAYYYQRLKLYYNQVKRNLNLTVDPSSISSLNPSSDPSHSSTFPQSQILPQLDLKIQQTTSPTSIQNFKTQSKALEDLLNFLKTNSQLHHIQPYRPPLPKKTSKELFRDIILQQHKNKPHKNHSKVFITFYSRDGSLKKQYKPTLKLINSQKLPNSKSIHTLHKQKESRILQKLNKFKQQVLDLKIPKTQPQNKPNDKLKHDRIDSAKKNQIKLLQVPLASDKRNSLQKLTIKLGTEHPLPKEHPRLSSKPKKSHSQPKLKQLSKVKGTKAIQNKAFDSLLANKKPSMAETQLNQLMVTNTSKKRPISRRKSLDLSKMKSLLPQTVQTRIDPYKKQDYMTQRYDRMVLETPKKLMIRTSNVSPVSKKQHNHELSQIVLEKSDNIVSIKKKKLQMLKNKIQQQKTQRK